MTRHESMPVAVAAAAADPPAGSGLGRMPSKALNGGQTCFVCGKRETSQWHTMLVDGEVKHIHIACGLLSKRIASRKCKFHFASQDWL